MDVEVNLIRIWVSWGIKRKKKWRYRIDVEDFGRKRSWEMEALFEILIQLLRITDTDICFHILIVVYAFLCVGFGFSLIFPYFYVSQY